jgi:hypothetical protein
MHKLEAHMARHGIPERVVNDNDRQYSVSPKKVPSIEIILLL